MQRLTQAFYCLNNPTLSVLSLQPHFSCSPKLKGWIVSTHQTEPYCSWGRANIRRIELELYKEQVKGHSCYLTPGVYSGGMRKSQTPPNPLLPSAIPSWWAQAASRAWVQNIPIQFPKSWVEIKTISLLCAQGFFFLNLWPSVLIEDLSFLLPEQTQFLFIVWRTIKLCIIQFSLDFSDPAQWLLKKETAQANETKGFKVKRLITSWADEMRVWKLKPTLFGEAKEKSNLPSFNCCPPLSCLLPCPSQIFLWQSWVFHWTWNTAKPLQGPLNIQAETYSYEEEIFFFSFRSPSEPLICSFYFLCLLSMQKQFSKNKGSTEWFNKFWIN